MLQKNDKVTINHPQINKTYGISPNHVFDVVCVDSIRNTAKLNNGWNIDIRYLAPVATQPSQSILQRYPVQGFKLRELVEDQIDQMVLHNKMFTVYDITKETRSENPNLNIVHEDVKRIVEDVYETFGLMRTLIDIATPNPWLYHDADQEPSDYVKQHKTGSASLTTAPKVLSITINFK